MAGRALSERDKRHEHFRPATVRCRVARRRRGGSHGHRLRVVVLGRILRLDRGRRHVHGLGPVPAVRRHVRLGETAGQLWQPGRGEGEADKLRHHRSDQQDAARGAAGQLPRRPDRRQPGRLHAR
ncbi:hypothetical protein SCOCK_370039 [Actinacidiphila cocklensis]|uniref:Uncharacterized protein n=1 Tax=Actinacidiphila cocklensis TaxID=887465 RepID=A0A9W4GTK3_9ACTN|nr:hypothetical protein SCOCK_370039 [Actinacidiphila cocklensis]